MQVHPCLLPQSRSGFLCSWVCRCPRFISRPPVPFELLPPGPANCLLRPAGLSQLSVQLLGAVVLASLMGSEPETLTKAHVHRCPCSSTRPSHMATRFMTDATTSPMKVAAAQLSAQASRTPQMAEDMPQHGRERRLPPRPLLPSSVVGWALRHHVGGRRSLAGVPLGSAGPMQANAARTIVCCSPRGERTTSTTHASPPTAFP